MVTVICTDFSEIRKITGYFYSELPHSAGILPVLRSRLVEHGSEAFMTNVCLGLFSFYPSTFWELRDNKLKTFTNLTRKPHRCVLVVLDL